MTKLIKFNKREINVKQHVRKGKIVKASKRRIDKKKLAVKSAIVISSTLGIAATSYLVLKKRYINNLNKFADNLKPYTNLSKYKVDKKSINFTIGGLGDTGDNKGSTLNQSRALSTYIQRNLGKDAKNHKFFSLNHKMEVKLPKSVDSGNMGDLMYVPIMLKNIAKPFFQGKNEDSLDIAQNIYNYAIANPGKPINLIGYSAGSNISKDVQYILQRKGISANLVTIGGSDFKIINPQKNSLHLVGDKDYYRKYKHDNAKTLSNIKSHSLKDYLLNPDGNTTNLQAFNFIKSFLYPN